MSVLATDDVKVTHRQEIIKLLSKAIEQEYQFSYISAIKRRVASNPIELISVNTEEATLDVGSEIPIPEQKSKDSMMFRLACGGLSIVFKSRMADSGRSESSYNRSFRYKIDLPYAVSCIQSRKSVRVDLQSLSDEVPVVLTLSGGTSINGEIVDISTSGARIRVNQDLTEEFKNFQTLKACRIDLPSNSVLQTGAQLLAMKFDQERGASTLGCQFVDMLRSGEDMLEKFVSNVLEKTKPLELVIAS
jgi:c-di-GMP-binding flagellar brake protein YcgR